MNSTLVIPPWACNHVSEDRQRWLLSVIRDLPGFVHPFKSRDETWRELRERINSAVMACLCLQREGLPAPVAAHVAGYLWPTGVALSMTRQVSDNALSHLLSHGYIGIRLRDHVRQVTYSIAYPDPPRRYCGGSSAYSHFPLVSCVMSTSQGQVYRYSYWLATGVVAFREGIVFNLSVCEIDNGVRQGDAWVMLGPELDVKPGMIVSFKQN